MSDPQAVLAALRRSRALAKQPPRTIVRYTGHPPVAEQIADQVRSGTGMTYGRPGPQGARMFPALSSPKGR